MREPLSKRQQKVLAAIIGLGIVILGVYLGLIMLPLAKKSSAYKIEIAAARQQLSILEMTTAREPALQDQHRKLLESVASWRARLPNENRLSEVIQQISELATRSGVRIQSIVPQQQPAAPATPPGAIAPKVPYQGFPLQIEGLAGFHQLGDFVAQIEGAGTPMQVMNILLTGADRDPTRHKVKIMVQAFIIKADEEQVKAANGS